MAAELRVSVTPRAAAERVGPFVAGVLAVRVHRPPADGEANRSVLRLVARALRVPPSALTLVAGERSRHKRLRVEGLEPGELASRLADLAD